ncbi:protein MIS12 homolog [Schistocerca nitens]|uniref:protein MIS12 homolog n=1 Tax=Schistocerca nitens TaxID=7011 RepID=UPI002117AEB1|nr:protein MIS12 homolog [Schistocerca nitens]
MDPPQYLDSQALLKGEYETQFFGFSSRVLFVHLKDCINDIFSSHATSLQDSLIKKRGCDENEAKSATDMLIRKCECALQAHSDDLQIACDSNFGIPNGVLLPEDNAQKVQYSSEEAENLERELDCLMTRLTRAKAMKCHLASELEEFEKLKAVIEKMQNLRLEVLKNLVKQVTQHEQQLKRLSKVSKSICSVTSKTTMDKTDFPHKLVKDKFRCSPPE